MATWICVHESAHLVSTPTQRPTSPATSKATSENVTTSISGFVFAQLNMLLSGPGVDAREPSFTAMWCAWARNVAVGLWPNDHHDDHRMSSPLCEIALNCEGRSIAVTVGEYSRASRILPKIG